MGIEKLNLSSDWKGWVVVKVDAPMTHSDTYPTKKGAMKAAERIIQKGHPRSDVYVMSLSSVWVVRKK